MGVKDIGIKINVYSVYINFYFKMESVFWNAKKMNIVNN